MLVLPGREAMSEKAWESHDGKPALLVRVLLNPTGTCSSPISCRRQLAYKVDDVNEFSFQDDVLLMEVAVRNLVALQDQEQLRQVNSSLGPRLTRRLADQITAAFYKACWIGDLGVVRQLVEALECEVKRSIRLAGVDRRHDSGDIAAVQARYELEVTQGQQEQERPPSSVA